MKEWMANFVTTVKEWLSLLKHHLVLRRLRKSEKYSCKNCGNCCVGVYIENGLCSRCHRHEFINDAIFEYKYSMAYKNEPYISLETDASFGANIEGMGSIVAGLRTEAESLRNQMLVEAYAQRASMQIMISREHDAIAPPQSSATMMEEIKKVVEKPKNETQPKGRRIKI